MKLSWTIGTDPEFILTDGSGTPRSAIGVVTNSKKERKKVLDNFFYYDNVLLECTVTPASDEKEFLEHVRTSLKTCVELVKPLEIASDVVGAHYPDEEMTHKDAMEIACDPEFCAYKFIEIDPPKAQFKKVPFRTTGGHIHVGTGRKWSQDKFQGIFVMRMMDLFLAIPSLFLDTGSGSAERRELYGNAGRHRITPHGMEYRTLSNFWVFNPDLVSLVYQITDFCVNFVNEDKHLDLWSVDYQKLDDDNWHNEDGDIANLHNCFGYNAQELQDVINNSDKSGAEKFIKLIKTYLPDEIMEKLDSVDLEKRWDV